MAALPGFRLGGRKDGGRDGVPDGFAWWEFGHGPAGPLGTGLRRNDDRKVWALVNGAGVGPRSESGMTGRWVGDDE